LIDLAVNTTNTSHYKEEKFIYEYSLHCIFCPQKKNAKHEAAFQRYITQAWSPFLLLKPASELGHARLLFRLS
jgi:hypothetical protein